ncbi:hypothetical protein [Rhodococcus sp. PSBB049]|uniref:hypothetical protein n=1 Tax=Rhodococcus sp. PSBB049 TaxID=2812863 RepID=UPI001F11D4A7|nr:hypothetical protein [Rhodococcus sp. PSBB049]
MGRTETTTTLWMIEDLEPWLDEPEVGQVCEPATQWITPDTMDLPAELVRTIAARVEELETDAGVERRAHLGHGFSTMLPSGLDVTGDTTVTGCLFWDRYLWTSYRTQPAGRVLVTDRRPVIQRAVGTPTELRAGTASNTRGRGLCTGTARFPTATPSSRMRCR